MTQRHAFGLASVVLIASGLTSGDALAQNALDRNLGVGTGGYNAARPANDFAARNAVITGEVVGGREFRGRVGYTAPGDFRARTPVNDLYRFRADSALSNPGVISSMSTSSFDQLRFGQGLGILELQRNSTAATPQSVFQSPTPPSFAQLAQSRLQFDNVMLSATSAMQQASAVQPSTLRTAVTEDGAPVAITASSVRGLAMDQLDPSIAGLGLNTYDQARLREDIARGAVPGMTPSSATNNSANATTNPPAAGSANRVGTPFDTRFENLQADSRQDTLSSGGRIETGDPAEYERILQRIADRYARAGNDNQVVNVDPAILERLSEEYRNLKIELGGVQSSPTPMDPATGRPMQPGETPGATSGTTPGTSAPGMSAPGARQTPGQSNATGTRNPADPRSTQRTPAGQPGRDPLQPRDDMGNPIIPSTVEPNQPEPFDVSKLAPVLRHGEKVEKLTSQEQGRFNELMIGAEEQLKKGEYMLAEQRFQRALRFSPGDPMAMAGAGNSQIGAGLYLSASMTIRTLFTQHPEMIDTTYAEGLLPTSDRLAAAAKALRSRFELPADRAAYAFLLAYVGRQTADRAMMDEGLKIMATESPDDPLEPLLRAVWLEGGEVPQPAPAPEQAPRATPEK